MCVCVPLGFRVFCLRKHVNVCVPLGLRVFCIFGMFFGKQGNIGLQGNM